MWACGTVDWEYGQLDVVKDLIKANANVNAKSHVGELCGEGYGENLN